MFLQRWLLSPDTSQQHHFHPSHYALHQTKLHQRYAFYRLVAHLVIDYLFQPSLIHHLCRLHRTCRVTRSSRFHSKPCQYGIRSRRSNPHSTKHFNFNLVQSFIKVMCAPPLNKYSIITLQPSLNKTLQSSHSNPHSTKHSIITLQRSNPHSTKHFNRHTPTLTQQNTSIYMHSATHIVTHQPSRQQ